MDQMAEGNPMVDAELVLRFKGGEESAFEDLVRLHTKDAFSFCLRLTGKAEEAEELSQEGFVSAYRALRSFRGESTFRSWLFRILINRHRDRQRRRKREETRLGIVRVGYEQRQAAHPEESAIHAGELEDIVKDKVETLPDRQREVLILHLYHGLNYTEIAHALDCSYDDVKMNLSLARKRLKKELAEYL